MSNVLRHKKLLVIFAFILLVSFTLSFAPKLLNQVHATGATGQTFDEIMAPFWSTTTMYNESVLMVSNNGGLPEASLLFDPINIISVRNSALNITYQEGVDWVYQNGKLKLLAGSAAPSLTMSELYPTNPVEGEYQYKTGGGYVLFHEGSFFHDRQLAVTYTHAANAWNGPTPQYDSSKLPHTISKLTNGQPLNIVVYGDSIAGGCNVSSRVNAVPYMDMWGDLIAQKLRNTYGSIVTITNTSQGGEGSGYGAANASTRVAANNPDLVIIAWGMNDVCSVSEYQNNIQSIMNTVRASNPNAEFILVSTTVANPETNFSHGQDAYLSALQNLQGTGVALANMTGVHQQLLTRKAFRDMTGNNINHPNDFLARWYAQYIAGLLVAPGTQPVQSPWTAVDDTNSALSYTGTWYSGDSYGYLNGTCHYTYSSNNYVQYSFQSTGIRLIGPTNNDRGLMDIYIDNMSTPIATINTYSPNLAKQQLLYENTSLSNSTHTIRVVSRSGYAEIDGFAVYTASGTPTTVAPTVTIAPTQTSSGFTKLSGTAFGTTPSGDNGQEYDKASDGNTATFFDYINMSGGYTGIDIGAGNARSVSKIRFYPRSNFPGRMVGGKFQGSNSGTNSGFVDLYTIPSTPAVAWTEVTISDPTAYRYLRYLGPDGGCCNIAEMEFYTGSGGNPTATATPVITATPGPTQGTVLQQWNFNTNGNTEGWVAANQITGLSAINGQLDGTSTGGDPYFLSGGNLGLNITDNKIIKFRYKNNKSDTIVQIFFITNADGNWTESKSKFCTVTSNDGDYTEYTVDMSTVSGWTGTLNQLRFDPGNTSGAFSFDYISVGSSSSPASTKLTGAAFGTSPAGDNGQEYDKASDGNTATFFDYINASGGYTGIDLGSGNAKAISKIRFFPRANWAGRMVGGKFQGSNTSQTSGYTDLYVITSTPAYNWTEVTISDATQYRYLRYLGPDGGCCNIAEMEFYTGSGSSFTPSPTPTASPTFVPTATPAPVAGWDFNSGAQGWTGWNNMNVSASGGYLTGTMTGADPYMGSAQNLGIAIPANKQIKIKIKNNSNAAFAKFYYITNDDSNWTESKSLLFSITSNDSAYTEYTVDMSGAYGFSGTLKQLRLSVYENSGSFSIDYITIG